MTDFDDQIRRAVRPPSEDHAMPVMDRFGAVVLANSPWIMAIGWLKMLIFVPVAAGAAVMFFRAPDTRAQIAWASVFVVMAMGLGIFIVLVWIDVQRVGIMREIKRLELQVARLAEAKGKD